jgi:hypothetical protein
MPELSPLAVEEYRSLRATIRERGTLRLAVLLITILAWATLAVAILASAAVPIMGLVSLAVLVAGFEVAFAAHVGVERVGRFLQVHYEAGTVRPGWEHTAMRLTGGPGNPRIDPLLGGLFAVATLLNMVPIVLLGIIDGPLVFGAIPLEPAVYGLIHVLFIARIVQARRYAATQRQHDLAMFESLMKPGIDR